MIPRKTCSNRKSDDTFVEQCDPAEHDAMKYEAPKCFGDGELKTIFRFFENLFSYFIPSEPARRETLKTGLKIVNGGGEVGDY